MGKPNKYLFVIGHGIYAAMNRDDIKATIELLKEIGAYHLPFDRIDIEVSTYDQMVWIDDDGKPVDDEDCDEGWERHNFGHKLRYTDVTLDEHDPQSRTYLIYCDGETHDISQPECFVDAVRPYHDPAVPRAFVRDMLICALATKNAVKETRVNKLAMLGIGKKHPHTHVTTIRMPSEMEAAHRAARSGAKGGAPKCPHWRRGHLRERQHYGPNREFVRAVWIAPIFVNADPDWIDQRTTYNVAGHGHVSL